MPQPNHRWIFFPQKHNFPSVLANILSSRGIGLDVQQNYLFPESITLENPEFVFPDLTGALSILETWINAGQKIAICGDYDTDGMTSTALLIRAFRALGGKVTYAIPSRMKEGYGINTRIVEEFFEEGITLIITVDNGISAYEPIKRARELGILVIVTDHHEVPETLPPANAILNPKLINQNNVWSQVSGVGMAFVLAHCLAYRFGKHEQLINPLTELLTLGTIADMVPLTGVNRRWVKRGLKLLPNSSILGIQALIAEAGIDPNREDFNPDDVGFKLAPRINAVGRIGDPQVVIDLLTTDDPGVAMHLAYECEETNTRRQELSKAAKEEAIKIIESGDFFESSLENDKVIVLVLDGAHKGIVGIVASALVEKYGVPAFVGTYSDDGSIIHGSARGGSKFDVHAALEYVGPMILNTYGGHKAAGGFSLNSSRFEKFRDKLVKFAQHNLTLKDIGKPVKIDLELKLHQINANTFSELQYMQPFGMSNPEPVFVSRRVKVKKQESIGKTPQHARFVFEQDGTEVKAVGWDLSQYLPLPDTIDVAYKIKKNVWQGKITYEMTLESFRTVPDL